VTAQSYETILIGVCLAGAIAVFFWSLDTVRRERTNVDLVISQLPRRRSGMDFRDTVDRVMQPIADVLSERNRRAGKVTLAEELAKAGMRLTSSEYLLIQLSLALGLALLAFWIFGFGLPLLLLGGAGYLGPQIYMRRKQDQRQRAFADQLGNMITLLSNALKTGYSLGQAIEIIAKKAPPPVSDEFEVVTTSIHFGTSVEEALAALVKRVQSAGPRLHRGGDPAPPQGGRQPAGDPRQHRRHDPRPAPDEARDERAHGPRPRVGHHDQRSPDRARRGHVHDHPEVLRAHAPVADRLVPVRRRGGAGRDRQPAHEPPRQGGHIVPRH